MSRDRRNGSTRRDHPMGHGLGQVHWTCQLAAQPTALVAPFPQVAACHADATRLAEFPEEVEPMDRTALDGLQRGVHACRGLTALGGRHEYRVHLLAFPLPFGPREQLGRAPHDDIARLVAGTRDLSDNVLGNRWRERLPEEGHVPGL